MKATGIVRRIDDLGRVVIPKEIRRTMRIREGDPLEIFTEKDGEVIFKKYSPIGELGDFAVTYADTLSKTAGKGILITDRDNIIAVSGLPKKELMEKRVSRDIENVMSEKSPYKSQGSNRGLSIADGVDKYNAGVVVPIVSEGDTIGSVIFVMNDGEQVGEVELSEAVFGIEPNEIVLHAAIKNHLANCRQGTQSALTKGEVSYTTAKPWRQKGTGRARAGYKGSPVWTHGGVAFAPKPRSYRYTMNRKEKRIALKSALSVKAAESKIFVVDGLSFDEIKTKACVSLLEKLGAENAMIVTETVNENVIKSARNIPGVETTIASVLSTYDIMKARSLVVDKAALAKIEEVYC